ncbi:MAG: AraC family transcriptional regulator [Lachnospiraceae bacterium]|nr:AraC family transcriptional regulator [Lachnospiraceae bacterium]
MPDETAKKPDEALFSPAPLSDIDFPVNIYSTNLSKLYMRMIRWEWHDDVEITLVKSGHALLRLSDQNIPLSPGDGFFLNQNQLHSIRSADKEACILHTIKFHPSFLFGYGKTGMSAKYLTPVLSSSFLHCLLLKAQDDSTKEMHRLAEDTFSHCLEKRFGYELAVKSLLCYFWKLLLPFATPPDGVPAESPHNSIDSARIKQAILFIENKYMEPLTLEEIAASIHVSKSECCRCFQRALGLTPFEYLLKFRIFESTRKIMRGDEAADSISTLAASVGFNSTSYYNKLFKKYLNCTPTEYKKSLQKPL